MTEDLEDRGSAGVTCSWKINRTWRWHGLWTDFGEIADDRPLWRSNVTQCGRTKELFTLHTYLHRHACIGASVKNTDDVHTVCVSAPLSSALSVKGP